MQITAQGAPLLDWLNAKLGTKFDPAQCRWVGGHDAGGVVWVVVYSRFSERDCELTIATDGSRRWATRRSLGVIASVPFKQWNLRRVTFVVAADNAVSLDMMQRLGAVREGCLRKWYSGDVDGAVFGILKEECRWLR